MFELKKHNKIQKYFQLFNLLSLYFYLRFFVQLSLIHKLLIKLMLIVFILLIAIDGGIFLRFDILGTKYEGNGVSTVEEEGILKDLKSATDDEKLNLKMNTVKTIEESSDNRHLLLSPSELVNDYGLGCKNEEKNATSSWLMSPESVASTSTASSKRNADADAMLQSEYRASSDLACPPSPFDTTANQRETWDELRTIETTGSDTFDLLSYLCDVS